MLLALPATASEIAERLQIDEATASQKLDEFVRKGVAIPLERGGVLRHFCVSGIIQFHDSSIHAAINKKYYQPAQDEIIEMWQQFRETEWFEVLRDIETSRIGRDRVLPSRGALKDESQLLPGEDLKAILREAPAIGVVDCPCRWLRVKRGECDKPTFVCLSLSLGAVRYIVGRGIGRQISFEEACQILGDCEEAGLIPTSGGEMPFRNICFCCVDCCLYLHSAVKYGYDVLDKSRYEAVVNEDLCSGCQACIDRCQFGAIEMKREHGSKKYKAAVDAETCYGCGVCVVKCPVAGALTLKLARPEQDIPVLKTSRSNA